MSSNVVIILAHGCLAPMEDRAKLATIIRVINVSASPTSPGVNAKKPETLVIPTLVSIMANVFLTISEGSYVDVKMTTRGDCVKLRKMKRKGTENLFYKTTKKRSSLA